MSLSLSSPFVVCERNWRKNGSTAKRQKENDDTEKRKKRNQSSKTKQNEDMAKGLIFIHIVNLYHFTDIRSFWLIVF